MYILQSLRTLRSLIDGGCGIVGGGGLEKISKLTVRGLEKSGKFNSRGRGGGVEFLFFFLSFLTVKTTYCRTFYIQYNTSNK